LRRIPFFLVLPVATGVALVVSGLVAWQQAVVPWFEKSIANATGHRTEVRSLVPRWRGLEARDVVLYGTPPFEAAPLARISRLHVALGRGNGWALPRALAVTAEGALITYLAIGVGGTPVDNLRGSKANPVTRAAPRAGATPTLIIKDSRLEAFVRLEGGGSLSARCERIEAQRDGAGRTTARWEGLAVDLPGWATVKVPRLDLAIERDSRRAAARDVALLVPGGGSLLAASTLDVISAGGTTELRIEPAPKLASPPAPAESGTASAAVGVPEVHLVRSAGGLTGSADLRDVRLAALQPVLRKLGLSVSAGTAQLHVRLGPKGDSSNGARSKGGPPEGQPIEAELTVRDLGVYHPRLDEVPWQRLGLRAEARLELQLDAGKLAIRDAELEALGLGARLSGSIGWRPALSGELRIQAPRAGPVACADVLAAWPSPLVQKLRGLVLAERVAVQGRLGFDARNWDDLALELAVRPLCAVKAEPRLLAQLVTAKLGERPAAPSMPGLAGAAGLPDFVALRTLPSHLVAAFLTAEDGAFRHHNGFDLEMVRRAIAHNLAMGMPTKGASTISQQLAKNLFLSPERTLARKLAELVLTWRLEEELDKDRILELYLNVVELGPGIRGIGRAAAVYFGKPAAALTPLESAHLAAMLPNPIGFARRFRDGRVDDGWLLKLYDLLARMRRSGALSEAALVAARASHLGLRKF
jgi:hypothetical protein